MSKKSGKYKWEEEYENLKNKDIDKEVEEIETILKNGELDYRKTQSKIKDSSSEEYLKNKKLYQNDKKDLEAKLFKYKNFKQNKDKIGNLLEYREKQKDYIEKLKTKKSKQEEVQNNNRMLGKESKRISEEHDKLIEEKIKLDKVLKVSSLSEEDRVKLKIDRDVLDTKIDKNNKDYMSNQNDLTEALKNKEDLTNYDKEIKAKKAVVSKCNMICRNLFEGKTWDDIELSLTKWNDKTATKNANAEPQKGKDDDEDLFINTYHQMKKEEKEEKETSLEKVKKFDIRHPIESIKRLWNERKPRKQNDKKVEEKEEAEENLNKTETKNKFKQELEFYQKVADKSFKNIDREQEKREKQQEKDDNEPTL